MLKHRCIIAVTGHRDVLVTELLREEIVTFFQEILAQYYEVTLLSPLAEGADMLVADIFLAQDGVNKNIRLQVPLPFTQEVYIADFSSEDKAHFTSLLAQAEKVFVIPSVEDNPYVNLGRYLVAHSDILLALWDGTDNHKSGGTADVLGYAKKKNHSVFHIHCQRS